MFSLRKSMFLIKKCEKPVIGTWLPNVLLRGDPPMVMAPPSPPLGWGGVGIGFMLQASALESSLLGPPRGWDCEDCLFHFILLTKKSHGAYHMDCILHCNAAFSCTALLQTPTQHCLARLSDGFPLNSLRKSKNLTAWPT